uniref:hypothetical protein n=1 Tax=Yoonia sp. TaxID=2212373 RepID=UPI004048A4EB
MRYTYNEFTNFCMKRNKSIRVDGDMVWSGTIPLPESLIKRIFFGAERLLSAYLDHLISSIAIAIYDLSNNSDTLNAVPSPEFAEDNSDLLIKIWTFSQSHEKFTQLQDFIIKSSGLGNYTSLDLLRFNQALKHKGKKYARLYVPTVLKKRFGEIAPKINNKVGISNGDMFGNVIADDLNIYRSGFSDAFAGIFKEYLEFKFLHFDSVDPSLSVLGVAREEIYPEIGALIISKHQTNSLWEPRLGVQGAINALLNDTHPLLLSDDLNEKQKLDLIILALSHEEMHTMSESEKELIESFRQRVSQTLKGFVDSTRSLTKVAQIE